MSQFDPPGNPDGSTLSARAVSGLRWSSLGYAALLAANVVYTVTMSRLLDPVAFGLMALAQIVVLFAKFFVRMGLASALVQKPELSREDVRAFGVRVPAVTLLGSGRVGRGQALVTVLNLDPRGTL